jgi:hypothetical protein
MLVQMMNGSSPTQLSQLPLARQPQHYLKVYSSSQIPFYQSSGNHDDAAATPLRTLERIIG